MRKFNGLSATLIILLILSVNKTWSQETIVTYYNKDNQRIDNPDSAYYHQVVRSQPQADGLFELNEYFKDGTLKRHGHIRKLDPLQLEFEGELTSYFENGNMRSSERFQANRLTDTATYYYTNGIVKERLAVLGIKSNPNGTSLPTMDTRMVYYADSLGNIQVNDGTGEATIIEGENIENGRYENGLRTGHWKGTFMAGKYHYEEWFENGEISKGITTDSVGKTYTYSKVEIDPAYPGGIMELMKFVANNYRYPKEAIKQRIKGQVQISFVVNEVGELVDFKIVRDLGYGTGEAAVSTLKQAPKWTPGYMRGVPVRVAYTIPIRLNLS